MGRARGTLGHVGSGVVTGRDGVAVVEVARPPQERPELHVAVAVHAGARRLAAEVRGEERLDDAGVELALEVEDVERHAELRGHAAGVLRGVGRAAALLHLGVGVGAVVDAHPDADDVVAGIGEERGGDRRIDAPGHRDEHAHPGGLRRSGCRAGRRRGRPSRRGRRRGRAGRRRSRRRPRPPSWPGRARGAGRRGPSGSGMPIAVRTCDGSGEPVAQAEPVEAAIPARSSATAAAAPSAPRTSRDSSPGSRSVRVARQRHAVDCQAGRLERARERRPGGRGWPASRRRPGRRRSPSRPPRPRSRSRPGGGAPGSRRGAGRGAGCRGGSTGRRRPSAPRTCGRRSRRCRRRARRRRGRGTGRPGRRRRGGGCRAARGPGRRSRARAGSCRPRCWRA